MTTHDLDAIRAACNDGSASHVEWFALADWREEQGQDEDAECCRIVGRAMEAGRLRVEDMGPRGKEWCESVLWYGCEDDVNPWQGVDVHVCREAFVGRGGAYQWCVHGMPRDAPWYGGVEGEDVVEVPVGAAPVCRPLRGSAWIAVYLHPADVWPMVACE